MLLVNFVMINGSMMMMMQQLRRRRRRRRRQRRLYRITYLSKIAL